jgi:DNA-binding transcriptional LysR family regulator
MRALVHELDETIEQVSTRTGELHGRLRITAPMTFGTRYLGPVLAAFAHDLPRLELALDLDDRIDLVGNGYDMAIRIGRLRDSSLIARKFCLSRRVVCCSPAYAQARGLPMSIEDLCTGSWSGLWMSPSCGASGSQC